MYLWAPPHLLKEPLMFISTLSRAVVLNLECRDLLIQVPHVVTPNRKTIFVATS